MGKNLSDLCALLRILVVMIDVIIAGLALWIIPAAVWPWEGGKEATVVILAMVLVYFGGNIYAIFAESKYGRLVGALTGLLMNGLLMCALAFEMAREGFSWPVVLVIVFALLNSVAILSKRATAPDALAR